MSKNTTSSSAITEKSVHLTSLYRMAQNTFQNAELFRHAHQLLSSILK